jgi:hypothetical protein
MGPDDNNYRPLVMVPNSTTEERATEFKRQLVEHLTAVKDVMAEAEKFGFQVTFSLSTDIHVSMTKTF